MSKAKSRRALHAAASSAQPSVAPPRLLPAGLSRPARRLNVLSHKVHQTVLGTGDG